MLVRELYELPLDDFVSVAAAQPEDVRDALLRLSGARLRGELHPASSTYDLHLDELPLEFPARRR